jgi:NagD protein
MLNNDEQLFAKLRNIRHVALDMDGTIYNGSELFSCTKPFLAKLKELGIGYSFLTNNPSKNISDYLAHLNKMGVEATQEEMFSSAQATIEYIKKEFPEYKRLFILGTESMIKAFEAAGFISTADDPDDIPDALVVSFDLSLNYKRLCRASWWAKQGLPYIATNPDKVCPTNQRTVLVDCGSIYTCIEYATGRKPDVVIGKPDPRMLGGILAKYSLTPDQVMMVGDRIYTDVQMAANAGAVGVLVLSGETTLEVAEKVAEDARTNPAPEFFPPDLIARDVKELGELLIESRK